MTEGLLPSGAAMGTQAGAVRGDRLSLRIGHGGKSDGWNAASSTGHEQALGSGQSLRFVAIPLRSPLQSGAARGCLRLCEARKLRRIAVVAVSIWGLGHYRHATKDASTKASAGMPPAIADLIRPPVLCLGRSSPGLRFASQSHKSCRTAPPAWSARRNTCQSRSASLDIRCLPCLLIWHSQALIARTVCHRPIGFCLN